jgi:dolichol-phosphate mannosyltransferase
MRSHNLLVLNSYERALQLFFRLDYNDLTNAFKAYRKTTIDACSPLLAPHFNLTVEIPLKAVVRGYTRKTLPITWRNRGSGDTKLKIKEMGAAICLPIWTFGSKNV